MTSATHGTSDKADDTAAQIARLREQIETLMKERVSPTVAEAAGTAASTIHDATDAVRKEAEAVAGKVREQPLLAILIAAAVGYVLGRATR